MSNCHEASKERPIYDHLELQKSTLLSGDLLPTSTILYCVLIVALLFKYKRQQRDQLCSRLADKLKRANLRQMPRPPSMPLIGHLHLMRDYQHNPWEGFNAIRRQYGDLVSLKMGIHQMVLISSVDHMNEVLIKKGDIFADRPSFPRHDIVFGGDKEHSLALCNWSSTHRARRKFCKRGVVPNKLSARNQLLEKVISELMGEFLADIVDNDARKRKQVSQASARRRQASQAFNNSPDDNSASSYNVNKHDLLFLTGDIFMKFLCNETRPHEDKAYENFNIGCDFIFYDINQCYLLDFMPYLTSFGLGYSYLKQVKGITDYCRYYIDDNIFEPRRSHHLARQQKQKNSDDEIRVEPTRGANEEHLDAGYQNSVNINDEEGDYLDSIIKDYIRGASAMSLDDYKVGFADLLAGHAAVTNILMRLLGHLALDLATQEMIYEETKRTRLTSLEQMPPLPVTEAALHEALRLASSPIVPHVAREDSSIGDYFVPKGSAVLFNCYNINLSPELWDEPRLYRPTRFLRTTKDPFGETCYKLELPKYFMPFSIGRRQCLGYKMVESISIAAAAYLCSEYTIRANNEQLVERLLEPKGTVALNPIQECFELQLYPR